MKTQFCAIVATFSVAQSDAFNMQRYELHRYGPMLSMVNSNANSESTSSSTDDYIFPSVQFQQMEEAKQGKSRFGIRKTLKDVVTTFATHREVEAAGLIDANDRLEDVNRKAAEKFAAFSKLSQAEQDSVTKRSELQNVLVETAAALGRTTGQIFGGNEPENFRN
jgi:hypothetical protein